MPWEYLDLPEALRLPPCPHCGNRGGVSLVADCLYVCATCQPARLFGARWQAERRVELLSPTSKEATG